MTGVGVGGRVSSYDVLELLDRGEAGPLYKVRDRRDGGLIALEVLPGPPDAEAGERLRREAEAAAALGHPHVCPALEIGETGEGGLFVARALGDGETLRSRLERGPLLPEQAVGLASQIAAALGRAHEKGIVHRDLRPGNVLVSADGQARVTGFGLAWLDANGAPPAARLAYRSPEQLRGGPVDARTDVWSLGVLLYEMVTGRLPFRQGGLEPMSAVNPGVPAELDEVVARTLSEEPDDRPARMDDLLVSLRGILAGGGLGEAEATLVQVPGMRRPGQPGPGEAAAELFPEPAGVAGRAVAHYRLLEPLGGGAMGTVFKAEDTRLRRTVALKFLPAELTRDPVAKGRFLQEAQAASALDHPNICTIHEVGETEDGHLYLAMAAYDGETVKAKIGRGPLPVALAVEIARQAAQGLAKAHSEGIVHRDVKPANLMVTRDGMVKILDFGVAKLRGAAGLNVAGAFLGTPAYMSPEQARGEEVDPRADVWSLGVVLYEMLAGARPFQGGDELAVVLRSLLEDRPQPLGRLRPGVPPGLERAVERMLAKAPAERPTAAAALAELNAVQSGLTAAPARSEDRRIWLWAAIAAALLAAGTIGGALALRRPAKPLPAQPVLTRLTDQDGRELYPTLSPDGRSFAYAKSLDGQMDVLFQQLDGSAPLNLTAGSPVDDTQPGFSPDGRWIAFRSERDGGGIYVASVEGGPARRVSDLGYNPAWSPDGREIAVATEGIVDPGMRKANSEIWRVEVATGRRRLVVGDDGVQPSWSPHGHRIAYWGLPPGGAQRILWTVPTAGGTPRKALDDGFLNWNPVWSPDGAWLYFGSDRSGSLNLWRLPIDETSGAVLGEPEPVTTPALSSGFWSLSRDGRRILYAANESRANVERFPFDPERLQVQGPGVAVTRGSHPVRSCSVSPHGQWIAFFAALPQEDLFVIRADGSGLRQLTNDRYKDRHPSWSPDGRQLLFYSNRGGGGYEAWILRLDNGKLERALPPGAPPVTFSVWSADGRWIACSSRDGAAVIDLDRPLEARRAEVLPSASAMGESFYPTAWSADGERLAGNVSRLDGSMKEGIGAFLVRSRTYQRWTSRGLNPIWLRDGRRLLFIEGGKILAFDTITHETRKVLSPPPSSVYTVVSMSPDDRSLYAVRGVDEGDVWLLTLSGREKGI
jgi:serine/threonine protein kinase/WD40 repeat protein